MIDTWEDEGGALPLERGTLPAVTPRIDSRVETYQHISHVRGYLLDCAVDLMRRAHEHDNSKLRPPEREAFDRSTARLKRLEYGSSEYEEARSELGGALGHHYAHNDHHPEHFAENFDPPIAGMNLLQVLEMLCDWLAAVKRMENGSIYKSIELNQARFGYSDDFKLLLIRTVPFLDPEAV